MKAAERQYLSPLRFSPINDLGGSPMIANTAKQLSLDLKLLVYAYVVRYLKNKTSFGEELTVKPLKQYTNVNYQHIKINMQMTIIHFSKIASLMGHLS